MDDPYGLERFVQAQARGVYERALSELQAGRKRTHWMWFIYPQVVGLGSSAMAERYAIASLEEARAYLAHPVLGPRLLACVKAMIELKGATARQVLGQPDDLKFHSSLTLFHGAAPGEPLFRAALDRYFEGAPDPATQAQLAGQRL
jgi:uncharacterized protein (DUF1810 family)